MGIWRRRWEEIVGEDLEGLLSHKRDTSRKLIDIEWRRKKRGILRVVEKSYGRRRILIPKEKGRMKNKRKVKTL